MRTRLKLATASLNQTPLDWDGNLRRILNAVSQAQQADADLLLLPELSLTGYGCEDMFLSNEWLSMVPTYLSRLQQALPDQLMVAVGTPLLLQNSQVYTGVALLSAKGVHGICCKQNLARNTLHYEPRWFHAWPRGEHTRIRMPELSSTPIPVGDLVFDIDGVRIGFEICEDSWVADRPGRALYNRNVDLILNPSASHFAIGKQATREQFVVEGSRAFGVVYCYANLQGCEAGRAIYDGGNMIASDGKLIAKAPRFGFHDVQLTSAVVDLISNRTRRAISSQPIRLDPEDKGVISLRHWPEQAAYQPLSAPLAADAVAATRLSEHQETARALALGLWDWQRRTAANGFVISLSGGADSALCAAAVYLAQRLALSELGLDNYMAALPRSLREDSDLQLQWEKAEKGKLDALTLLHQQVLPKLLTTVYQGSDFSSDTTENAAAELASSLSASHFAWSISSLVDEYVSRINDTTPDTPLTWQQHDLALQNIQARVRAPGVWLLANRENKLLITTSNLSEASVGYCTMDGDTAGGLAPIGGISKSRILELNLWLLEQGLVIGGETVKLEGLRPVVAQRPTAELRPVEQTDEADLMPFAVLDAIRVASQQQYRTPLGVLHSLRDQPELAQFNLEQLAGFIERYYGLYCRNQWKRERIAVSFHIEQDSADPKSYRRFPVLNSLLRTELAEMHAWVQQQANL